MSENVWTNVNLDEEDEFEMEVATNPNAPTAVVNGATVLLDVGDDFRRTVIGLASDAGYGKFKVYLNGSEIRTSEAPEVLNAGDVIRVTPFDKAA
jgi:hypothetical protein